MPDRHNVHYRLYVMRGTRLVPIPFQVDARDVLARYVFDRMLGGGGGPFDDDDELVFMASESHAAYDAGADVTTYAGARL